MLQKYNLREIQKKDSITWYNNDTVSYLLRRKWTFIPEKSVGEETDMVTTINMVLLVSPHSD